MQQSSSAGLGSHNTFTVQVGRFLEGVAQKSGQDGLPATDQSAFFTTAQYNKRRSRSDPTLETSRAAPLRLDDVLEDIEESIDLAEMEGSQYLEYIQRIRDGVDATDLDEARNMVRAMKDAREEQPLRVSRLDISRTQAGALSRILIDVDEPDESLDQFGDGLQQRASWYGGENPPQHPSGLDPLVHRQTAALPDTHSFWGMVLTNSPPIPYVPKEAEDDSIYQDFIREISAVTPQQDREIQWISPAASYSPALIRALYLLYPEHTRESSFAWEIVFLNDRVVLTLPLGGPFIYHIFHITLLIGHLLIPDNAMGLALFNGTSWRWISDEVAVLFEPLGMNTDPFPMELFKRFLFTSLTHIAVFSRQTPDSVQDKLEPTFLPERSIRSPDGVLYDAGEIYCPPLPLVGEFSNRVDAFWIRLFGGVGDVVKEIRAELGPLALVKTLIDGGDLKSYRVGQGLCTPYTGTFNQLLFERIALSSTSPYCIRGGIFALEIRQGRPIAGVRPHAILWVMGLLWIKSIVYGLPPPEWSEAISSPLVQAAIKEILSMSDVELENFLSWELATLRGQDIKEGRGHRNYEANGALERFDWRPIYDDPAGRYNPRIAVRPQI